VFGIHDVLVEQRKSHYSKEKQLFQRFGFSRARPSISFFDFVLTDLVQTVQVLTQVVCLKEMNNQ
jgi:hypothetical protein